MDENGRTALILAAWNGRNDVVKFLLAAKADTEAWLSFTLLDSARFLIAFDFTILGPF